MRVFGGHPTLSVLPVNQLSTQSGPKAAVFLYEMRGFNYILDGPSRAEQGYEFYIRLRTLVLSQVFINNLSNGRSNHLLTVRPHLGTPWST